MTSLLSTRWRYLWTYIVILNFDIENMDKYGNKPLQQKRLEFAKWVDGVLRLHQSERINKFIVHDLNKKPAYDIKAWISFALAKKVESLHLDFLQLSALCSESPFYTFPCSLFTGDKASSVKSLYLRGFRLHPPREFDCFKSLTSLSLKNVCLTEDTIDYFLTYCSLEHLCVEGVKTLTSLKVMVGSVWLKYLEVYHCWKLKNIKVYTTNLVSLKYDGPKISLSLESCPQLVDVCCRVNGAHEERIAYIVGQYQSCLSQLKTLTLALTHSEVATNSKMLPTFSNLKTLVLQFLGKKDHFTTFTSLLKVCPLLHRFELHLVCCNPHINPQEMTYVSECVPEYIHQFLKEVELSGFEGSAEDMELAIYLFNNVVTLDKFTVDPRDRRLRGNEWFRFRVEDEGILSSRERAKQLLVKKPPNVLMTIL
ncbi:hypothetical protein U1Q18_002175 [Sarracenia purpurea var. burkii]